MATTIPNDGLNWVADAATPGVDEPKLQYVSVGTGTSSPKIDDTDLESETYRSDIDTATSSIDRSSSTGSIRASITVSGGTEVPSGEEITELGIFTESGELVYREVRDVISIGDGERVTFEFIVSFVN